MTVPPPYSPTNLHSSSLPTPRPRTWALPSSPKEDESRPTERKVHRLFNGVMATSLPRPDLIMTAASRVSGLGRKGAGWAEAMQ